MITSMFHVDLYLQFARLLNCIKRTWLECCCPRVQHTAHKMGMNTYPLLRTSGDDLLAAAGHPLMTYCSQPGCQPTRLGQDHMVAYSRFNLSRVLILYRRALYTMTQLFIHRLRLKAYGHSNLCDTQMVGLVGCSKGG
jgi:hypothetical protein